MLAAGVSKSSMERHSEIRPGAVTRSNPLRQQHCLLHSAYMSADLLSLRSTLQHHHRTHSVQYDSPHTTLNDFPAILLRSEFFCLAVFLASIECMICGHCDQWSCSVVCLSVCMYVLSYSWAKTAERIEVLFVTETLWSIEWNVSPDLP